jgi:hypothetical protein
VDVLLELLFGADADFGAQAGVGGDASTRPRLWASRISSNLAVSIKNFIKDPLVYHKSTFATTQEALQTAFGAEKIGGAALFGPEGLPPGDKGLAHRVLDQEIRPLVLFHRPGRLGPEAQRPGHRLDDQISHISQAEIKQ